MPRTSLALLLTGCVSLSSCTFLGNRLGDLRDVLTLSGGFGLGARVRVAPSSFGIVRHDDRWAWWGRHAFADNQPLGETLHFLTLGRTNLPTMSETQWKGDSGFGSTEVFDNLFWPISVKSVIPAPYYTDCEVILGLGVSVRIGLNPGELLDFVLGWVGVDIYSDDAAGAQDDKPAAGARDGVAGGVLRPAAADRVERQ